MMDEAVRPVVKWIPSRRGSSSLSRKLQNITTPHPFKLSAQDCSSKHSLRNHKHDRVKREMEERQKNLEIEQLKQFRANPIPANTFLPLFQRIQNAEAQKREMNKERVKAQLMAKQKPFDLSCYKEPVHRCSSVPNLKSEAEEKHGQLFRASPLPKSHNGKPLSEIMAEQEILREIRLRRRAEQLIKASVLPFSIPRDTIKKHRFEDAVAKEWSACETTKPKSQYCTRPSTVKFEMASDVEETEPKVTVKRFQKSASKDNEIAHRGRSSSMSALDCPVPRMTYGAILREQAIRKRSKENPEVQNLSSAKQKELVKMRRDLLTKITLNKPSVSKEERLRRFREDSKARVKEYHQEMQQMAERVKARPFLVERQSELSAIHKLDKKFRELLRKQGLDEDFVFANSKPFDARRSSSDISVGSEDESSSLEGGSSKRTRSEDKDDSSDSSNYTSDANTEDQSHREAENIDGNSSVERTAAETELPERDVS